MPLMKNLLVFLLMAISAYVAADTEGSADVSFVELNGFIISTLSPTAKIRGKAKLFSDRSFEYVGNNNVKLTGKFELSGQNGELVGTGMTELPTFLFFQIKYPDGSKGTAVNLKGRLDGPILKGSFSSKFEQGLFFFALPGHENALQAEGRIPIPAPDDLNYTHADKPGGTLIVLPGEFKADPEFAEEVSAITMMQTAEAELQRAGFRVIENSRFSSALPNLVKAYASGALDSESAKLFGIGALSKVQWVVFLEMEKATRLNRPQPQQAPSQAKKSAIRNWAGLPN